MEYARLGSSGMTVSRLCLGCMGFGDAGRWIHKWVLNEEDSRPIIRRALELGINFFDTANVYSLGTDYIDLYQIHRWDSETPIEETMEALNDVVRAGKTCYIGASAMWAWQFQKALPIAGKQGWSRFVSMQNHYNLLYREEEREMLPLCREEKVGSIPSAHLHREG